MNNCKSSRLLFIHKLMNNNRIVMIKKILLMLVCICLFYASFGKSLKQGQSGGHEADIYSVLPFDRNDKIDALILIIHNNIDLPVGYFNG